MWGDPCDVSLSGVGRKERLLNERHTPTPAHGLPQRFHLLAMLDTNRFLLPQLFREVCRSIASYPKLRQKRKSSQVRVVSRRRATSYFHQYRSTFSEKTFALMMLICVFQDTTTEQHYRRFPSPQNIPTLLHHLQFHLEFLIHPLCVCCPAPNVRQ